MWVHRGAACLLLICQCAFHRRMVTELKTGLGLPKWGPVCRPLWLQTVEPRNAIPLGPSTAWTRGAGSNEQELLSPGSEPHSGPISHTAVGKGTNWWQAAWVGRAMLCAGTFLPHVRLALGCT